jgi:hypothetical protein
MTVRASVLNVCGSTVLDILSGDGLLIQPLPTAIQGSYGIHILPCPETGNGHWCCGPNGSNCCGNAFKLQTGKLMLLTTLSAVPTPPGTATTHSWPFAVLKKILVLT